MMVSTNSLTSSKRMSDDPKKKENAEKEIAYLTKNKERMRYAEFRPKDSS